MWVGAMAKTAKYFDCLLLAAAPQVMDQAFERSLFLVELLNVFSKICEASLLFVHVIVALCAIARFAL
jgi:hypothetical protein